MDTKYEELVNKLERAYNWHKKCWENLVRQPDLNESEIAYIKEEKLKMELLETILSGEGRS